VTRTARDQARLTLRTAIPAGLTVLPVLPAWRIGARPRRRPWRRHRGSPGGHPFVFRVADTANASPFPATVDLAFRVEVPSRYR
jgi:hypothetical protein